MDWSFQFSISLIKNGIFLTINLKIVRQNNVDLNIVKSYVLLKI
jgi:hypothetical protein